jgi:hypothetical protein
MRQKRRNKFCSLSPACTLFNGVASSVDGPRPTPSDCPAAEPICERIFKGRQRFFSSSSFFAGKN